MNTMTQNCCYNSQDGRIDMLVDGQYRLAKPKKVGKRFIGIKLCRSFMPEPDLSRKELIAFKEYLIYDNSGRCWACGSLVGRENLEQGHLVDRICGGDLSWTNLRPMCYACNRIFKPFHNTLSEAYIWRREMWHKARCYEQAIKRYLQLTGV